MKKIHVIILMTCVVILFGGLVYIRDKKLRHFIMTTSIMENTIPVNTRMFAWCCDFDPERFEVVAFKNPDTDTAIDLNGLSGYYRISRILGKEYADKFEKKYFPLKKRDIIVGRIVGLPGDNLEMIKTQLYVNGEMYNNANVQHMYHIKTDGNTIPKRVLDSFDFTELDFVYTENRHTSEVWLHCTNWQINKLLGVSMIDSIFRSIEHHGSRNKYVFPYSENYNWNRDNFGKLTIPKKGVSISLTTNNLPLYHRIITVYERNTLIVEDEKIIINGKETDEYTPKMDYYFWINDNRHNSLDSRFLGFLPEDHISARLFKKY